MVDALAVPALLVITGLLIPFGMITDAEHLRQLLLHPLTRLVLFGIIALTFIHAAHRLRFTLIDLGFKSARAAVGIVCYGGAILGTLVAAAVALGLL